MPYEESRSSRKIMPAAGVNGAIKKKSRTRRDRHRSLTEIAGHAHVPRNDLLPKLSISYVSIDELRPARRQLRRRDAAQIARIRASIAKFGVCQPLLVDGENCIVHGHSILEAARAIGLSQVPVIAIDHLSAPEVRLLSITLNRLGETGRWDEQALQIEFEELIEFGEDLVVSGFEEAEIDMLRLVDDEMQGSSEEDVPTVAEIAVSRPGDLWLLGRHRLLQGDARHRGSYEGLLQTHEQARFVLTDPPFNVPNLGHVTSQAHREFAMAAGEMSREEFAAFNCDWMERSADRLLDGGFLATFIDWRSIELVLACGREVGLDLINLIVWLKSNAGQGSLWRSGHELLPVFKNGKAPHVNNVELGRHGRWRSNIWTCPGASSLGSDARDGLAVHPTVKPRALLEDALLDVTNRDEIVLDPFAGSGSTLIAAESVGRICRAIEIDGLYCDVIIRRWQAMTGEEAVLAQAGKTFAAIAEIRAREEDR